LLRPHQWLKNLLLLFPPFLGGTLSQVDSFSAIALPLLSFSVAASCIYVVNDLLDINQDSNHPRKCLRPLPSGKITKRTALWISLTLGVGALLIGSLVSSLFLFYLLAYLGISLTYSWYLKTLPIVELFCVVSGFLLRLFAGGEAFNVHISDWLFLSVFLLALYLICGKRLSELKHDGGQSPSAIRPVLAMYPQGFLDGAMYVSGASVLVTYTMYVLVHPILVYTVPLCCFGLLTYLLRVMSGKGGDPTRALLKDPSLLIVALVWIVLTGFSIYGGAG
jgi:4-hydroxybenzoate polyprenyltransferase